MPIPDPYAGFLFPSVSRAKSAEAIVKKRSEVGNPVLAQVGCPCHCHEIDSPPTVVSYADWLIATAPYPFVRYRRSLQMQKGKKSSF